MENEGGSSYNIPSNGTLHRAEEHGMALAQ
jgi:hypothetical protein